MKTDGPVIESLISDSSRNEPLVESPCGVVRPLPKQITPTTAFRSLANLPGRLLLESSMRHATLGRYSFLMADPFDWFACDGAEDVSFDWLNRQIDVHTLMTWPDGPPFQGGVAGLLSYDLNRALERVRAPRHVDVDVPSLALGAYDVILAWDHLTNQSWLISSGLPEKEGRSRQQRAARRADEMMKCLECGPQRGSCDTIPRKAVSSPQYPVSRWGELTSNLSPNDYQSMLRDALELIAAGDVYQVNLAQQLLHPAVCRSDDLYERLSAVNPSPFSGFFDTGRQQIISASPERFVAVRNGIIETRPIKGTRRRTRRPEIDWHFADELASSEKDRAENVMIVDLMRNDLSRICRDDSVRVTQLLKLEEYQSVLHLVSAIKGELLPGTTPERLIRAVFPGGSVTGAPKIRAMEIIAELEPSSRGGYCGCLGYFGFDGSVDLNILIRTITACDGWWQIPVGGGIVSHSLPESEYEETWTKAAALLQAIDLK